MPNIRLLILRDSAPDKAEPCVLPPELCDPDPFDVDSESLESGRKWLQKRKALGGFSYADQAMPDPAKMTLVEVWHWLMTETIRAQERSIEGWERDDLRALMVDALHADREAKITPEDRRRVAEEDQRRAQDRERKLENIRVKAVKQERERLAAKIRQITKENEAKRLKSLGPSRRAAKVRAAGDILSAAGLLKKLGLEPTP
jgi:hypothetical protein